MNAGPRDNARAAALMLQAELGMDVDIAETLHARGHDTAEQIKARKPEVWRAAKAMIGHGITPKKVEELLGLDIRIVLAIQREGEADGSIPPYKQRTVRQLESVITLGLDELLDKAKAGKLTAIELCALADKRELLSGGVTARTEVVEDPAAAEFRRFLAANPVRGMVSGAEEIGEKGRLLEAGGVADLGMGIEGPAGVLEVVADDVSSPDDEA